MRRWLVAFVTVVTLGATAGAAAGPMLRASVRPAYGEQKLLTILVVGSDIGPPARPGNPLEGRADAIHVIAVDTRKERATVVDVPRDGYIGGDKVNAHLAYGGPGRLVEVMEDYTGVEIDYHAVTSFKGLRKMVDAMGGVVVDVPQRIQDAAAKADLKEGRQRLSGKDALAFVRTRKTISGGDFTRTKHQGQLLLAAQRQLRRERPNLVDLTRMVTAFSRYSETDIDVQELFGLAVLARQIKPKNIEQVSLSGSFGFSNGQSIVNLQSTGVWDDIRNGKVGR